MSTFSHGVPSREGRRRGRQKESSSSCGHSCSASRHASHWHGRRSCNSLTPRHSGTVWSTYQFTPKFRFGGGLNARGSDTPQQSTIVAKRFITADLMAEYNAGPAVFKLNLTNITNITNALYADTLYRGHYTAGKPRTVQMTTTVKF